MLELAKSRRMQVYQQDLMGPIWMYRMDCDESVLPLGRGPSPQEALHDEPNLVVVTVAAEAAT